MTHAHAKPDFADLTAALRLWAAELCVWLIETLGENALTRSMRAWLHHELGRMERGAQTLVVMAALKLLPPPPPDVKRTLRPLSAAPGFRRVFIHSNEMRGVTKRIFPRERDLLRRAQRLSAVFEAMATHAQRVARRIARFRPVTRMAMVVVLAEACVAQCRTPVAVDDSS